MKLLLILVSFEFLYSVSIFEFAGEDFYLELPENTKLCNVKYVNPISQLHTKISECVEPSSNLVETIDVLKSKLKNKKEVIFSFFGNGSGIRPTLKSSNREWKLAGIIFNYKENLYKFEVYDKEDKYFYFEKDINSIKIQVNQK